MSLSTDIIPGLTSTTGISYLSAVQTATGKFVIRDLSARGALETIIPVIDELSTLTKGGVHYIGKIDTDADTRITDGSTTNPITIGGASITAVQGDMVSQTNSSGQDSEFIFNGTTWYEVGSTGSLKALAFKDEATGDWSQTTNTDNASPTVDFSGATFSGTAADISAEFTGVSVSIAEGFSGTSATLTANVETEDITLMVDMSNANVTGVTGLTSDAIASVPDLTVTTATTIVDFGGDGISYKTAEFARLTEYTSAATEVGTGWTGSATTFKGSYTPEGTITANVNCITSVTKGTLGTSPLTASHSLNVDNTAVESHMNITDLTAAVKVVGTVNTENTVATGNITGVESLVAEGTISKPPVTFTSNSGSFLNDATVTDEVLTFGSGTALINGSAELAETPTFKGTGCTGSLAFAGTGFVGDGFYVSGGMLSSDNGNSQIAVAGNLKSNAIAGTVTVTGGTLTGDVVVASDDKPLTGAKFTGTLAEISASGIPLGDLSKTSITYVNSVMSSNSQVAVTGNGSVTVGPYATDVEYDGDPNDAIITLESGKLSVTGTQQLTYQKPTTVSIKYTPSGTLTTTGYTPTGTVMGKVIAAGKITGKQNLTHKHGVTVGGTVTVS